MKKDDKKPRRPIEKKPETRSRGSSKAVGSTPVKRTTPTRRRPSYADEDGERSNGPRTNGPRSNGVNPQQRVVEMKKVRKKKAVKVRKFGAETVVLVFAFLLFAVSIGGSLIKLAAKDAIPTMVVLNGSIDIPKVIDGIIIRRDEKVYVSPVSGDVIFNVPDVEKVRKGAVVCSIKDSLGTEYLEAQSEELSKVIMNMQNQRSEVSAVSSEVTTLNNKIKSEINKNLLNLANSDYSSMYKLKASLKKDIDLRNDKLLNENGGSVKTYVDQYRQYTGKIAESTTAIVSAGGGVVSYGVDGYESAITFDNMTSLTKEQTRMKVEPESFVQATQVKPDDAVFKVVESNDWYIAAYIDNDLIPNWKENGTAKIYIDRDGIYTEHSFKIYKLDAGEKESFVILESNKQLIDYLDMRTVSFKTSDSVHSGIKIPESAICERTFLKIPSAYVSDLRGSDVVNKKVGDKLEQVFISRKYLRGVEGEGDFVYIMQDFDNIKRGDTIITGLDDTTGYVIEEIVPSKGVFRTNTGLATFISISTDGMVKGNKGYVILNATTNSGVGGLTVYDRIVTDAINNFVKEGDMIN